MINHSASSILTCPGCYRRPVKETFSVCKWFDVEGNMAKDVIMNDVEALLKAFESSDTEPKKSK